MGFQNKKHVLAQNEDFYYFVGESVSNHYLNVDTVSVILLICVRFFVLRKIKFYITFKNYR
jgi:hypothetical protein